MNLPVSTSNRPYLIRALYEWCTDNGFTPYVAVSVDSTVQVPREYVKNNEIVLNIGFDATSSLTLGNEFIEFKARFGGSAREILVPISNVIAIYARENGQGMVFPLETSEQENTGVNNPQVSPAVEADTFFTLEPQVSQEPAIAKIMQLVETSQETPVSDSVTGGEEENLNSSESPDLPKPPSRPRVSLKRVK